MAERFAGDVVDSCLNVYLLGTYSAQFNVLSLPLAATDTEAVCGLTLGEIGSGSLVSVDDELMFVSDRDTTNNRLIVVRGVRGTLATVHTAGTPIEVNPRFPRFLVRSAMQDEIEGWPESLYQPKSFTASLAVNQAVITVPDQIDNADVHGVISIRRGSLSLLDSRFRRTNGWEAQGDFFGAGGVIALADDVSVTTTYNVRCACGFTPDALADAGDGCDLISDVGLTVGMIEVLKLGASWRLLTGRASSRLFPEAQGQSRVAAEVPANEIPAFALQLLEFHARALTREVERLVRRFGFGGR